MLIEVFIEADLITDLGLRQVDPGLLYMGPDLAPEIGMDILLEWHIFGVAQIGVRFILNIFALVIRRPVAKILQVFRVAVKFRQ
jgi:hypothetical protein